MMEQITAVSIDGLNGRTNVRLPLNGGHCVIVGPNGSGKSTALQIISFALGRQWKQLASLRFDAISVEFGDEVVSLSRAACASISQTSGGPSRYGRVYRNLIEADQLEAFQAADLTNKAVADRFLSIVPLPLSELRTAQRFARMRHEDKNAQAELSSFQKALDHNGISKTLYLPTSRRIEFDISRFTERLPEYIQREFLSALRLPSGGDFFEEVLRFGMDDIQTLIADFERKTRDYSRNRFNKMMSFYLKEMANSQSISIHDLRSLQIDQTRVDTVLSRIEEGLLSVEEKSEIGNIVMSMARPQKGGHPPFHKRWLAHFFVRLLEVDSDIEERELPIRDLVKDLGKYLNPKRVSYDIESYHFSINDSNGEELKLGDLSSGEKQLVSLLTILQLSSQHKVNVFIDEPELSLSVPWQSEYLPDIVRARSCNQLFAVTHSPFIYENTLSDSVVDFLECASKR
jgi:energy-coupling factor transporter ATP-binding protein EcfA2